MSSQTPGEIDPADISINGALYYQNLFSLDGVSMNNDLDPAYSLPHSYQDIPGRSQGLAIDTSLISSINVYDSNVSASYGNFEGGVVEAKTKNPSKDFHAKISYQTTSSAMTKYHIDDKKKEDFANSYDLNDQPQFFKQIIRANASTYFTKNFGVIASFSTTQSTIPLNQYDLRSYNTSPQKNQHRDIYNYFLKAAYNPTENLFLETSVNYAPQDNEYFVVNSKDSNFKIKSGGLQVSLTEKYHFSFASWNNTLSYSDLSNSRRADKNYFKAWKYSEEKNWSHPNNPSASSRLVQEGAWGNIDSIQRNINFKSDLNLDEVKLWFTKHNFNMGIQVGYANAYYKRLQDSFSGVGLTPLKVGENCVETDFCSNSPASFQGTSARVSWKDNIGQYFQTRNLFSVGKININALNYSAYLEDDMSFYRFYFRPGVRLDADTYMDKITIAPRLSLRYDIFGNNYTNIVAGYNRYYGRNLFAYRLYDGRNALWNVYKRISPDTRWENAKLTTHKSNTKFNQLKVPYNDEFVAGISQKFWKFEGSFKYVKRVAKDQIRKVSKYVGKFEIDPDYESNYSIWTNEGKSNSDIFALNISNAAPIEFFHTYHSVLFGADYSIVKRNFNDYSSSLSQSDLDNPFILFDGKKIHWTDKPASNFAKPWTARFTTISEFPLFDFSLFWTNYFHYTSGYTESVQTAYAMPKNAKQIQSESGLDEYETMYFRDSFYWDTRIGTKVKLGGKNTLSINLDIFNLLDNVNVLTSSSAIAYQTGRSFWIEMGYEY